MRTLVLAIAITLALATTARAQAPAGDSVTGGLHDPTGTEFFAAVDAHSGPSGENPAGTARFQLGDVLGLRWNLDVTCLSVSGRTALVGFTGTLFTHFGFDETFPTAGLVRIVDGGGPGSALDSLAFASVEGSVDGPPIPGPTDCSAYPGAFPLVHGPAFNREGDLVVTDAPALPTSKDQCKHGGWRDFGVFRNQGACVSFVAKRGK